MEIVLSVFDLDGEENLKKLKRSLTYNRMAPEEEFSVSSWDKENSTFRKEENPLIRLRELFPPERLNLNLMTGEHMKDFTQSMDNRHLKQQIESLLQFPELKTTRDMLDQVRGVFHDQAHKVQRKSKKQEKDRREYEAVRAQIASCKKRIEKIDQESKRTTEEIDEQIEIMNRLSEGRDLEQQRKNARQSLDNSLTALHEKKAELTKSYVGLWRRMVTYAVSEKAHGLIKKHEDYEAEKSQYNQSLGRISQLEELLKTDRCVCLRTFDQNARAGIKNEIGRLKSMAPTKPPDLGFSKWTLESWSDRKDYPSAVRKIEEHTKNYNALLLDVQKAKNRVRELEETLSEDIGDKYKEAEIKKQKGREKNGELIRRKTQVETELNDATQKMALLERRLGGSGTSQDAVHALASTTDKYYRAFEEIVEKVIPHYREKLLDEVQSTFRSLYAKNRKASVRLNDNYIPYVLEPSDNGSTQTNVRLSEGEALRLGLALLISIRRVAHERPFLVIDAPFSDLDDTGIEDLLNVMAEDDSQIIILCKDRFAPPHASIIEKMDPLVFTMDWHLNTTPKSKAQGHTTVTPSDIEILRTRNIKGEKVAIDG